MKNRTLKYYLTFLFLLILNCANAIQEITKDFAKDSSIISGQISNAKNLADNYPDSSLLICNSLLTNYYHQDILINFENSDFNLYNITHLSANSLAYSKYVKLSQIYDAQGYAYDTKSNYNAAISAYQKSLLIWNLLEKNKNLKNQTFILKSKAATLGNLGIVYDYKGDYESSIEFYNASMLINQQLNDSTGIALNQINIGGAYYQMQQLDTALNYYNKAFAYTKNHENKSYNSIILNNIGLIYIDKNQDSLALKFLKEALAIDIELDRKSGIAIKKGNIGYLYLQQNDYPKAELNLLEALQLSLELQSKYIISDHYKFLYDLYETTNQPEKALANYKLHIQYQDSIQNDESLKEQIELESSYKYQLLQAEQQAKQEKKDAESLLKNEKQKRLVSWLVFSLAMLLFATLMIYLYIRNSRKKEILASEKRQLEIEFKLLRTQMNPHFIFNSLNAINAYINQDNSLQASQLLTKFSRLIRNILEQSTKEKITLTNELAHLKIYAEIEQSRFSNKFSYEVNIDPSINTDLIQIPSMILQPFLENAILHGVAPLKDRMGEINLQITALEKSSLKVVMIDNGVGRNAKKNTIDTKTHASLSIKLIEERLNLFVGQNQYGIEYTDNAEGTTVSVIIPMEYEF